MIQLFGVVFTIIWCTFFTLVAIKVAEMFYWKLKSHKLKMKKLVSIYLLMENRATINYSLTTFVSNELPCRAITR